MKSVLSSIAVLLATTGASLAADPTPVAYETVVETVSPVSQASGWYLRGDAGYSANKIRGAHFFQGGSAAFDRDFDSAKMKSSFGLGGGVGYQINDVLRTDATLDYLFKSDFRGSTTGGCGVLPNGPCTSRDISSMTAWSLMANAYVDFGTWYSITPYVGAGIGGTRINWKGLNNTSCETGNPLNCDASVDHGGKKSWRFTYALMAGASVDLRCDLKADIGYRYRRVTKGDMFAYDRVGGGPGFDRGFNIHEGRVGLRYLFNACEHQAYAEPLPVEMPVYK